MIFFTKTGRPFANDYVRVVIGGQGPYIEFKAEHITAQLVTTPGQEYRGKGKYAACKYFWLCPDGEPAVKVYHQRGTVSYADYKVGYYYVSPHQLNWKDAEGYWGSDLRAQQGNQPGEVNPTIYRTHK